MTSGGLIQLVAYGAQDVYLTANPQVTFFKQLYRRHSNFAMESIEQVFNGVGDFGKKVQCTISRNGDLITRVYVQATLPAIDSTVLDFTNGVFEWVPYIGQYLIKNVVVEIGGQQIDKQYGEWLHIWNELTLPVGKALSYTRMVGGYIAPVNPVNTNCAGCSDAKDGITQELKGEYNNDNETTRIALSLGQAPRVLVGQGRSGTLNICIPETTLYIPLEFWFNRHTGLALPLIALQYHEVKINIEFQDVQYLVNITSPQDIIQKAVHAVVNKGLSACSLFVDYIYLDTEERRRFAQVSHEYLIEQLQFTGTESVTSTTNNIKLSLNHPCKELIWVVQNPSYIDCNSKMNYPWAYTDSILGNPTASAKLQLNGQDRFTEREGEYFNSVQPYQHHTRTPSIGINCYSFALKPEDLQPSGTCNFSRIDNAVLNLTLTPYTFETYTAQIQSAPYYEPQTSANVNVYATNYNVLRIMSGMGGLAYSN